MYSYYWCCSVSLKLMNFVLIRFGILNKKVWLNYCHLGYLKCLMCIYMEITHTFTHKNLLPHSHWCEIKWTLSSFSCVKCQDPSGFGNSPCLCEHWACQTCLVSVLSLPRTIYVCICVCLIVIPFALQVVCLFVIFRSVYFLCVVYACESIWSAVCMCTVNACCCVFFFFTFTLVYFCWLLLVIIYFGLCQRGTVVK